MPQTVSTADSKNNFKRNTLINILFFIFNGLTSFFMVPYQIKYLGIASYGMVSLANSFVAYTQILTTTLVGTVIRFVTYHLAREEMDEARSYLNTQFVMSNVFFACFLPIAVAISLLTPTFLEIPAGLENDTRILFILVYVAFLVTIYCCSYQVPQFAKQRFDIKYGIEIGSQTIRYGTWIVVFNLLCLTPALWHIGLGYVLGAAFIITTTIISSRKLMPNMQPSLRGFDKGKCREMLGMGSWFTVDQIGAVLYLSIDVLIINRTLGPEATGEYATVLGLAIMLRGIASTMSSMVTPVAVACYARGDYDGLVRNSCRASKFVSVGMALLLGAVCGLAKPILGWWLGEKFVKLVPLVWWLMAHHVINCGVMPLFGVNLAANKIKVPGIATCIGGVFKVVLSVLLIKCTNLGIYGVAIGGMVAFTLKNALFTPYYAGKVIGRSSLPFFASLVPSILVLAAVSGLGTWAANTFDLAKFCLLAPAGIFLLVFGALFAWFIAFTPDDRDFFKNVLKKKS